MSFSRFLSAGLLIPAGLLGLLALTVAAQPMSGGDEDNVLYICDQESTDVCFDRPPLPAGAGGWRPNAPQGYEHDSLSDDPMGTATANPGPPPSACVTVTNNGGSLSGPNGDVVNGGTEGDCIEVMICWTYWEWVQRCIIYWGPHGQQIRECWMEQQDKLVCSPWVEVCPCE